MRKAGEGWWVNWWVSWTASRSLRYMWPWMSMMGSWPIVVVSKRLAGRDWKWTWST